ncbi:MAG: hypothetical protein IKQ66_03405 [Treponema sp.]|nr:hypothetical protein [Treponema sp.]MBR6193191.1 hypothetical protein [Treponema sp.]
MAQNDNSTFNDLVTEISKGEREQMLKNMKQGKTVEGMEPNDIADDAQKEKTEDLAAKIKSLSFFKRFIFWLTATFTNSTMEGVLNKSLMREIARSVDKVGPGLIDFKRRQLGPTFYEKLAELKKAAEFFAPYVAKYEGNNGTFYMVLGSLLAPELGDEIRSEADPYQYALNVTVTSDMKSLLVNKMEKAIDGISGTKKAEMYAAVRGVEWLRQFARLPFGRIISKFEVVVEGARGCDFAQVKSDFGELTKILSSYVPLTDESVQALYMVTKKKNLAVADNGEITSGEDEDSTNFINNAAAQNGIIKMFVRTVPILKIARLVFENSVYTPEAYGGGEGWFQKYRGQWKLLFERRWNNWERDSKKEKIKYKLKEYFAIVDFPLYPVRPWETQNVSKTFHYQLTLGFINYYFKNQFPQFNSALSTTSVEGDFAMRENRIEFSESLNIFIRVDDALELLARQLSAGGEYAQIFSSYEVKKSISSVDEARLNDTMTSIEKTVAQMIKNFGKACRSMKNLLGGIIGDNTTPYYGPVVNLAKLGGKENRVFKAMLVKANESIGHAYEFLQDIEPLDLSIEDL